MDKVKFTNLSWPIKIAVIVGIFNAIVYAFAFLIGCIEGVLLG